MKEKEKNRKWIWIGATLGGIWGIMSPGFYYALCFEGCEMTPLLILAIPTFITIYLSDWFFPISPIFYLGFQILAGILIGVLFFIIIKKLKENAGL